MTKPIIMAAVGVLYAAAAAWFVSSQGESYRRSLRERRAEVLAATAPKADLAPALRESAPTTPAPTVVAAAAPKEVARPGPAPVAKNGSVPPRTLPAPLPKPATPAPPAVRFPALVFKNLMDMTTAEEAMHGKLLHDVIVANHGVDDSSPYPSVVLDAISPLLDMRARKDVDITITVIDSNDVYAFSHLGGYIYMTKGLFGQAATPEEYRFVAGRELAHIDLKHGRKEVEAAMKLGPAQGVGTHQYLYHQIAKGYSREEELAADDWVIDRMWKLENTKRECLAFLRKFVSYSKENEFPNGLELPRTTLTDAVQDLGHAYKGKPSASERLRRLSERLNKL